MNTLHPDYVVLDGPNGGPHIHDQLGCLCDCDRCLDDDNNCICPDCPGTCLEGHER